MCQYWGQICPLKKLDDIEIHENVCKLSFRDDTSRLRFETRSRDFEPICDLVMSWILKISPCGALWMILDGWHYSTPPQFHIFTHPVTESTHVSYPACCIKRNTLWTAKTTAACGFGLIQGTCGQCTRTHQCLVPYPSLRHWIKYPETSFGLVSSEMSRSSRIRNFIVCTIVRETLRSIELPFRVAKWSFLKEKSFKKDVWKCDLDVTYYFFVRCHLN